MQVWLSIVAGVIAGVFLGGIQSIRLARQDDLDDAISWLRQGARIAAVVAMGSLCVLLRWPFVSESATVPEEVTRTVLETVEVPKVITHWFFWKSTVIETQMEPREVEMTVTRTITRS